jgi:hypothetical protein
MTPQPDALPSLWGLLGILVVVLGTAGCSTKRDYRGQVVAADSGMPIGGAKVEGIWWVRDRFAPSLDGLFVRGTRTVQTRTDEDGLFALTLDGFNRRIRVYTYGYEPATQPLDGWPGDKELIVRLEKVTRE